LRFATPPSPFDQLISQDFLFGQILGRKHREQT